MSAQNAVENIAAKQGGEANSLTPLFHSEQLQMIVDEFTILSFYVQTVLPSGTVSKNSLVPTLLEGFSMQGGSSSGFSVVPTQGADTGTILNNTGYDLDMVGAVDLFVDNSGGASRLNFWSETSSDNGVTWTTNALSARSIEISNNGESSSTKESKVFGWKQGTLLRFAFVDQGSGSCEIKSPTITARGIPLSSHSFSWRLVSVSRTPSV